MRHVLVTIALAGVALAAAVPAIAAAPDMPIETPQTANPAPGTAPEQVPGETPPDAAEPEAPSPPDNSPGASESSTGTGTVTFVRTWTETVEIPNGLVQRWHNRGVLIADDDTVPFHLSTQDCNGTAIADAQGKPISTAGYCDAIDLEGDAWFISWTGVEGGSAWTVLGGTGKYEGMTGHGTTRSIMRLTSDRNVLRWEGTWTLQDMQ